MTARQEFEFKRPGCMTTRYGVGAFPASKPVPTNYEDLLKMFHVANDFDKIINKKLLDFVAFITKGDLKSLKLIDEKFIKKFLNAAVMYGDIVANGLPSKGEILGLSPLMVAAMCGKTDVMRWLIEKGADIALRTYPGGGTAADFLKRYKEQQEKKRAEELRKQREKAEKQRQKDELNDLMDEVDGKKPPKPVSHHAILSNEGDHKERDTKWMPAANERGLSLDNTLKAEVERIKNGKGTRVDGPQFGKNKKRERQFGNGKGLDDLLGKSQSGKKKTYGRWGNELPGKVRDI